MLRVRIPLQLTGLTINNITGSQNSYPSDYVLASTTATVDASITEADLTITANDSFKFLNGTDPSALPELVILGLCLERIYLFCQEVFPFLEVLGRLRPPTPSPLMSVV